MLLTEGAHHCRAGALSPSTPSWDAHCSMRGVGAVASPAPCRPWLWPHHTCSACSTITLPLPLHHLPCCFAGCVTVVKTHMCFLHLVWKSCYQQSCITGHVFSTETQRSFSVSFKYLVNVCDGHKAAEEDSEIHVTKQMHYNFSGLWSLRLTFYNIPRTDFMFHEWRFLCELAPVQPMQKANYIHFACCYWKEISNLAIHGEVIWFLSKMDGERKEQHSTKE